MDFLDDDEQLKLAIAMSLGQSAKSVPESKTKVIDLTNDGDTKVRTADTEHANSPASYPSLKLDRKTMETERLARKRKAPPLSSPLSRAQKAKQEVRLSWRTMESASASAHDRTPSGTASLKYPEGVVKKTWSLGFEDDDDIKLEEVLESNDLEVAVLSSFQWDTAWLLRKLDMEKTKVVFVMQAKWPSLRDQIEADTADMTNVRLCFPSMEGQINCMHSKLMLLFHPDYLRIAIPTANLVDFDWGETGIMENMVFLIDLPRNSSAPTPADLTFFAEELIYFCKAMKLQGDVIASLGQFDFAATKDMAFVHTIGGAHAGLDDPWRRTGYCGLGRAINRLGLATLTPLDIDFIISSLGSINVDFLTYMYLAASGDDGVKEYTWRTTLGAAKRHLEVEHKAAQDVAARRVWIFFPSLSTVKLSRGGKGAGGTNCFNSRWWRSDTFPRDSLRDCKSIRKGLLMHNKIIFVRERSEDPESSEPPIRPWFYLGSANCSESAWGKLVKDKTTKAPKLNCRNWECGVILPVPAPKPSEENDRTLNMFRGLVPVPMEYPGQTMGNSKPWFFTEPVEQ